MGRRSRTTKRRRRQQRMRWRSGARRRERENGEGGWRGGKRGSDGGREGRTDSERGGEGEQREGGREGREASLAIPTIQSPRLHMTAASPATSPPPPPSLCRLHMTSASPAGPESFRPLRPAEERGIPRLLQAHGGGTRRARTEARPASHPALPHVAAHCSGPLLQVPAAPVSRRGRAAGRGRGKRSWIGCAVVAGRTGHVAVAFAAAAAIVAILQVFVIDPLSIDT